MPETPPRPRPGDRVAVVGAGISGLLAAWLLGPAYDVTLFEAAAYAGGHTNTVDVAEGDATVPVDTGFIVFNHRNYPGFTRLLARLGVASRPSDMSFGVQCARTGLEYRGSNLNTFFAQRSNLLRPRVYRILREILRFHREAPALLTSEVSETYTLGAFLDEGRYHRGFVDQYLVPMAAAVWSAPPGGIRAFPARTFVGFFQNHGFLQVKGRPPWRVIAGGSRTYVRAMLGTFRGVLRLATPVERIERRAGGVRLVPEGGEPELYDHVVLGVHSDQARRLLADASPAESAILAAIPYQANEAVLHTDARVMPRNRRAWASWNAYLPRVPGDRVTVTYDMTHLQGLSGSTPYFVTLNRTADIDPARILRRIPYHHPVFAVGAPAAQQRLRELNGRRHTWFCGAWCRNGFHEDGVQSALAVAGAFGAEL